MNAFLLGLFVFFMTVSGTFGAFFFKTAIKREDGFSPIRLLLNTRLYFGVAFYLLGAVLNIVLLRYMDYSILYPTTALTYIWTIIFSYFALGEKITKNKIFAILFILTGVLVL